MKEDFKLTPPRLSPWCRILPLIKGKFTLSRRVLDIIEKFFLENLTIDVFIKESEKNISAIFSRIWTLRYPEDFDS